MTQTLTNSTDQRIVLQGTWEKFKVMQQASADSPGVRLAFYDGTIEVLMPGQAHEFFKSLIGYLIETFFYDKGIQFKPTGSMTQEKEEEASAQADESYCIGESKPIADLTIEVVFSSGGEGKLARYRALGVSEVWFWQDGLFTLHHLRETGYERIYRSELPGLKDLDVDLLTRCVLIAQTDNGEAVRVFRQGMA